jgi:hypothetical protein
MWLVCNDVALSIDCFFLCFTVTPRRCHIPSPGSFNSFVFPVGNASSYLLGETYVNVHTVQYPQGEIRGQLKGEFKVTHSSAHPAHCKFG